jgi:hypothetical protein
MSRETIERFYKAFAELDSKRWRRPARPKRAG